MRKILMLALLSAGLWSCKPNGATLQNGPWQARLQRADGGDIVFNFDVKDSAGKKILYIRNAAERLLVDEITQQGDSIFIKMPFSIPSSGQSCSPMAACRAGG
ncbi:hypothetical protein MKQ70_01835 [Chitinophaga sedimenti]|uniref:hypothetical protein n=1 Tax=Chitinophaga sedimenti TaxID=2033606 RepID=UPI00200525DD|nr:hypothetical protein [Chitinophaga sedimenti]MCK7553811.1 hypothetical protein [Chitinophaga sedimenti]